MITLVITLVTYMFLLIIYCVCPLIVQIILFIINGFLPDPIPYLDEFIMIAATSRRIYQAMRIEEFLESHPLIAATLIIGIILILIWIF